MSRRIPVAIFACALLVGAASLGHDFIQDDRSIILGNPAIRDLVELPTLWTSDYWEPEKRAGLYRPLVTTSYALNFSLSGFEPWSYHAVNALLHALVSALVAIWCFAITGRTAISGAAGLLFAVHPVHVEAIANVVGRAELLSALFFFAAHCLWLRTRVDAEEPNRPVLSASYGACLVLFALALLCKESAVTLLGVVVLGDWILAPGPARPGIASLRDLARRPHLLRYAGLAAVAAIYLGVRFAALGNAPLPAPLRLDNPIAVLDFPFSTLNALQVALRYLALTVAPVGLSYDYSFDQIPMLTSFADWRSVGVLGLWSVLAGLAALAFRRDRRLFFFLGFFATTGFVVSNLMVPIGTILGERLLYAPSAGICAAIPLLVGHLSERLRLGTATASRVFAGIMAALCACGALLSLDRMRDWESEERLFLHDVERAPRSARAQNNAGKVLQDLARHREALEHFRVATSIEPSFTAPTLNAAYSWSALGRNGEAIRILESLVAGGSQDPFVLNNLGFLLVDLERDVPRGVELLERALKARSFDPELHDSLGWGYFKLGRLELARRHLRRSIELDATSGTAPQRHAHLQAIEAALRAAPQP